MLERAAVSEGAGGLTADSATVFTEFHRRLRAFVSRRVRNPADAEDIVQETFLRIHRHLAGVRGADRLAAWVFQVARSTIIDHYRRRRRPPEALDSDDVPRGVAGAEAGGDAAGEFLELATCLSPMIEALPATDRQAIQLSEIMGLTQREASSRAGVTLSGMKSRVQRARRKLKAILLECCHVELDRRGGIIAHEPRTGSCEPCRSGSASRTSSSDPQGRRGCSS